MSLRNEAGEQGLVSNIAIDPSDPDTIYLIERPSALWTPIAGSLQQKNPNIDPSCIAINPDHPEVIYMGTLQDEGIYVSNNRGNSWKRYKISGQVYKMIVDPTTSSNPATTVLYASTNNGVYRSSNGGAAWTRLLEGNITSLIAYIPTSGTPHFYAGVQRQGVFHTTDTRGTWTNLNNLGIGLPRYRGPTATEPKENFDLILTDYCPKNPNRVYAWFAIEGKTIGLYTTSSPLTRWTITAAISPPDPAYGYYCFAMAVAPNSPGDGVKDILFFGSYVLFRSIDAGRTWDRVSDELQFHADYHTFAFFPEKPAKGVIPAFFVGCDGGIAMSDKFADPSFPVMTKPSDFDEGITYSDSGLFQNYNDFPSVCNYFYCII